MLSRGGSIYLGHCKNYWLIHWFIHWLGIKNVTLYPVSLTIYWRLLLCNLILLVLPATHTRAISAFNPQLQGVIALLLLLIFHSAHTHEGMARLSWPGWLLTGLMLSWSVHIGGVSLKILLGAYIVIKLPTEVQFIILLKDAVTVHCFKHCVHCLRSRFLKLLNECDACRATVELRVLEACSSRAANVVYMLR